jgi:transposase
MGRPTLLNENTERIILKAVGIGMPIRLAAQLAGIDKRTLYGWKAKGKAGEEQYVQFFHRLKETEMRAVEHALGVIHKAAENGDWKAASWLLERRHADHFSSEKRRIREIEARLKEIEEQQRRGY